MSKTITFTPGDACNNCGGPMPLVPAPSDAQRKAASDPNAAPISSRFDTRPPEQIEEQGDLYRCDRCDSKAIVKRAPPPAGVGTGS